MSTLDMIPFPVEELNDKSAATISGGSFVDRQPPSWLRNKRNRTPMPLSFDNGNGGTTDVDEVEDVFDSILAASEEEDFAREIIAVVNDTF